MDCYVRNRHVTEAREQYTVINPRPQAEKAFFFFFFTLMQGSTLVVSISQATRRRRRLTRVALGASPLPLMMTWWKSTPCEKLEQRRSREKSIDVSLRSSEKSATFIRAAGICCAGTMEDDGRLDHLIVEVSSSSGLSFNYHSQLRLYANYTILQRLLLRVLDLQFFSGNTKFQGFQEKKYKVFTVSRWPRFSN